MFHLFDIALQLNGFPIKKAKTYFEKIQGIPEENFENYVIQKKEEIVNYHINNNPFYKEYLGKSEFENWNNLPIMTKKDFQKDLLERLSKDYKEKYYSNKTSGSSGEPFVFAKDKYCHALTWATIINRYGSFGINLNSSLQARFYGIPLDFIGNKKERIKDYFSHRYRFPIFDLSDDFFESVVLKFKYKKFEYINGYTSSIVLFAKFLQRKNIILNSVCPSLKCCIVTSEMLFDEDKFLMEKQFGIPIINEYGASELDLIAFQNINNELQVNSETLFVEILDEENNVLPYGKEGRIVITSLYNKAHPFIRYDIGDIGILDEKSTFKKPILKKLIGRSSDFVILPSGKKSPGLTFYYITKSIIEEDGNVKEFVIIQTKIDTFEVEYVSEIILTDIQIENIKMATAKYLESGLLFFFFRKEKLEREKSGKLKQFISMVK